MRARRATMVTAQESISNMSSPSDDRFELPSKKVKKGHALLVSQLGSATAIAVSSTSSSFSSMGSSSGSDGGEGG